MLDIAKRVFLVNIRGSKYVWFSMLFPIFLMCMIGAVLTNTFSNSNKIEKLTVYYVDKGTKESDEVFKIVKENKGDLDITFKEIDSVEAGKNRVRINEDGFIFIDGDNIKIYTNDKNPVHTGMLNGIFNGINNRMNAVVEMFKIDPKKAGEILVEGKNSAEFNTETIAKTKSPGSYDYYGVAELNLMVIYLAMYPLGDMMVEKRKNLRNRVKLAGLSNFKYYIGILLGYTALAIVTTLPGYIFSIAVLKTNWGSNYVLSYLTIVVFSIMTISFGLTLGVMLKDDKKATVVLQTIVFPAICFLGGSYAAIPDNAGGLFQIITNISPLRWMNRGIFRMAFNNDYSVIESAMVINIALIVLSIGLLVVFSKREEAM